MCLGSLDGTWSLAAICSGEDAIAQRACARYTEEAFQSREAWRRPFRISCIGHTASEAQGITAQHHTFQELSVFAAKVDRTG
mmetsp:Transcript_32426/g.77000  ORF Transcript_32426/g.77000 Transcript_32426/m.77000 type:complete len:82 (+) Transcript_32426:342-587(+)